MDVEPLAMVLADTEVKVNLDTSLKTVDEETHSYPGMIDSMILLWMIMIRL